MKSTTLDIASNKQIWAGKKNSQTISKMVLLTGKATAMVLPSNQVSRFITANQKRILTVRVARLSDLRDHNIVAKVHHWLYFCPNVRHQRDRKVRKRGRDQAVS